MKLYDRISERSRRLFVLRAATEGLRIDLEREFQRETSRKISRLLAALSKTLTYDGTLSLSFRQAQLVKRLPHADRKDAMNDFLDLAFNPLRFSDFKNSSELRAMNVTYRKWIKIMYEFGAITALRTMGVRGVSRKVQSLQRRLEVAKAPDEFIFELADTEIISQLDNRAINYGRGLSDEIIMDSRRLVRDNIYLGNSGAHETGIKIAKDSSIPVWRGIKIARTETQQAFNTACNDMYKRSGVKKHTWSTVGDRRVRPAHADNDGTTVEIGKSFPSGQLHPGDGPGSINCRCSVFPDLSDPNILLQPWDGKGGVPTITDPPGGITPKPRKPRTKSPFSLHKEAKNKLKKADAKIATLEKKIARVSKQTEAVTGTAPKPGKKSLFQLMEEHDALKLQMEKAKAARVELVKLEKAAKEVARKKAQDVAAIAQTKLDKAKATMEAAHERAQRLLSTLDKTDPKDWKQIQKALIARNKADGRYYVAEAKSRAANKLLTKYKPPRKVKSGDEIVQMLQADLDKQNVIKNQIMVIQGELDEVKNAKVLHELGQDVDDSIAFLRAHDEAENILKASSDKIDDAYAARKVADDAWEEIMDLRDAGDPNFSVERMRELKAAKKKAQENLVAAIEEQKLAREIPVEIKYKGKPSKTATAGEVTDDMRAYGDAKTAIEDFHERLLPESGWRARRSKGLDPKTFAEQLDEIENATSRGVLPQKEYDELVKKIESITEKRQALLDDMGEITLRLNSNDMKLKIIGEVKHGDDGMVIVTENISDVKKIRTSEGGLVDAVPPSQGTVSKLDEATTFVEDVVPKDRIEKGVVALEKRAESLKEELKVIEAPYDDATALIKAKEAEQEVLEARFIKLSDELDEARAANNKLMDEGVDDISKLVDTNDLANEQAILRREKLSLAQDLDDLKEEASFLLDEITNAKRGIKENIDWVDDKLKRAKGSLQHVTDNNGQNAVKFVTSADDRAYAVTNDIGYKVSSDGDFTMVRRGADDSYQGSAVHLTETNDTSVHIHELFHIMENDGFLDDSLSFLRYRAVNPKSVKDAPIIAKKTKIYPHARGKQATEVSWEDKFWNKYQGKYYNGDGSEIATMYMQQLYDDPIALIKADPEGFAFIVDTIRGVPIEKQKWFMELSSDMKKYVLERGRRSWGM